MFERSPQPIEKNPAQIRAMFAAIADRYDLMNRLLTLGRDRAWRREVIRRLEGTPLNLVLDVGAGTGDLGIEALRRGAGHRVVACDFTEQMLALGRTRGAGLAIDWVVADAQRLPFRGDSFDRSMGAFLLRNLEDLDQGLREQARILKSDGRAVWLDTSPLPPGPFKPLVKFYMRHIVPSLGGWLTGDRAAYAYLSRSSADFQTAANLAERIQSAGFNGVGYVRRMFGAVAIHWADRHNHYSGRNPS